LRRPVEFEDEQSQWGLVSHNVAVDHHEDNFGVHDYVHEDLGTVEDMVEDSNYHRWSNQ
jgi:hypothetical protein